MSEENNRKRKIKVKMRLVAFEDLPKVKAVAKKAIDVGEMSINEKVKNETLKTKHAKSIEEEGMESIF